ncbi:MAG: putative substrate-binding transporter protein component [Ilumatobacteraceae bacterium]|nr:putative substrate-binding transporter protein component [Ilumatobacteraceae bacterium]
MGKFACCAVLVGGLLAASCSSDATKEAATTTSGATATTSGAAVTTADSAAPETSAEPATTGGGVDSTTGSVESTDAPATSDAADTTTPAPDTSAPKAADDRAFKVMVIGDETSQISFTVKEGVPAVQGALADLTNVEVLHCDSAGDANAAADCERKAVDAGVAAVIVSFGSVGQDQSILTEAGIPTIGSVGSAGGTTAFSISDGLATYAGLGVAAGAAKCTKVATLYLDGADFLADMVKTGVELQGATEVARAPIAQNTPDIAPAVETLTSSNPDCIVLSITPTQAVQAVTALAQSGTTAQLIGVGAVFPPEVISELGDLAEGVLTVGVGLDPADPSPVIAQIRADMDKFDDKAPVTTVGVLSWASAKLIEDALPSVSGDVTAASLTAALQGLKDAPAGGAIHPFTAVGSTNPLFERFYNPWGLLYKIVDGVPVRQTEDYFALADGIAAAKMG